MAWVGQLGFDIEHFYRNHLAETLFIKPQRRINQLNLKEFIFVRKSILNLLMFSPQLLTNSVR